MKKIFDSHFHIIDPKFPLIQNNGFLPNYFSVAEYLAELKQAGIDVVGGVVVSGSFQGYYQDFMSAALKELGKNFVGIIQLPADASDHEIESLNEDGVRGIRFNLYRGMQFSLAEIRQQAQRVYALCKWKTEFYINSDTASVALNKLICSLPKASVDHLGMGSARPELLTQYLANGVAVRVTGFGRIDYSADQLRQLLPRLYAENPNGLIFGTDLPSTRAKFRFSPKDIQLIEASLSKQAAENVLYRNGQQWYLS